MKIEIEESSFLKSTARDFDLPIHIVESIYKKCGGNTNDFYERLGEEIKNRKFSSFT